MIRAVAIPSSEGLILRGILHTPEGAKAHGNVAAVLLPGLAGNRVGPHRLLFDLASRLADAGLPVLRCDPSGSGYSDGDAAALSFTDLIRDTKEMMDFLENELGVTSFLLGGICRGARLALATALADPRVRNLILLSCARLEDASLRSKTLRRRRYHLLKYFRKFIFFRWIPRLLRGDINFRLIRGAILDPVNQAALRRMSVQYDDDAFQNLTAHAVFVYGANDPDRSDSLLYYREKLAKNADLTTFETISDSDSGFYSSRLHQAAIESCIRWWDTQQI